MLTQLLTPLQNPWVFIGVAVLSFLLVRQVLDNLFKLLRVAMEKFEVDQYHPLMRFNSKRKMEDHGDDHRSIPSRNHQDPVRQGFQAYGGADPANPPENPRGDRSRPRRKSTVRKAPKAQAKRTAW